jgi:phage/plasmid-like protein (TIGR03299 family)
MSQDQMFSTRTAPWMKLGDLVERPQTAAEAAEKGGMNFTVSLRDVYFTSGADNLEAIPNRKAVVCDDNEQFMGFASGDRYNILNYGEAFGFMDAINPHFVAAGNLRDRKQGFMVVETGQTVNVLDGEDPHQMYAVLRTSHDCTRAVELSVMMLRGKCMNQLTLKSFIKGVDQRWSIKHLKSMKERLAEATNTVARMSKYSERFVELVDKMASTHIEKDTAHDILKIVIPQPKGKTERVERQYAERIGQIMDLWTTSPTVGYAGTGWGLVNAVSEQFDWYRQGGTAESRFLGALAGSTHKAINDVAAQVLARAS